MQTLKIYVTGILALWSVVDSWMCWECLCGHTVCEWCDGWTDDDMRTRYDMPVPYMSTYQHRITNPVTCTLDKL